MEVNGSVCAHGEYEPDTDPPLAPCPFCGGRDVDVVNTHTPCYWVECRNCGAEKHCPGQELRGKSDAAIRKAHTAAFIAAIESWNCRVDPTNAEPAR